jgi:DsbC/DsbD-like thiol-disulfide interchange protein
MKALLLALTAVVAAAAAENPVAWVVRAPAKATAGQSIAVQIDASIQTGWHLYSLDLPAGGPIATEISLAGGQPFALESSVAGPKPHMTFDRNFDMQVAFYTGKVTFKAPVKVAPDAPEGNQPLVFETRYQACDDRLCLPPKTVKVRAGIEVHRH